MELSLKTPNDADGENVFQNYIYFRKSCRVK